MVDPGSVESKNKYQEYLPIREAGHFFGYSENYITRLAREGKIVSARVGRQWLVDPRSIREFVSGMSKQKMLRSENIRKERYAERKLKRIFKKEPPSFVGRMATTSYRHAATLDKFEPRFRALATALGALATGVTFGFVAYTQPVHDTQRMLASVWGDVIQTVDEIAEMQYVQAATTGFFSTLYCSTTALFGFPCEEETTGDVLVTTTPVAQPSAPPPSPTPIATTAVTHVTNEY
ncbi:helix-turn-helix domain-containing protein, partial [Candidatus Kaiserbacteria bacterium]|nr:helix-turn-helix domain-containing protein [Candidatus Kaiserbacteria bacterium]